MLLLVVLSHYWWDLKTALDELIHKRFFCVFVILLWLVYYEGAVYIFSFLENEIEIEVIG